jgi:signal peptidase I
LGHFIGRQIYYFENDYGQNMRAALRDTGETIITAVVIFLVLQGTTQSFLIEGSSMVPNLVQGERLLVNRFVYAQSQFSLFGHEGYLFSGPQRGDIIVFHPPIGSSTDFVKRIIGVPGDVIDLDGESVYVSGVKTNWVDVTTARRHENYPVTVPPGEYFVMGDNRRVSVDSRNWGFVSADEIVGRAWVVYWPVPGFQLFS